MSNDPNVVAGSYTRTYYAVAALPSAATNQGGFAYVTDADSSPWSNHGEIAVGGGTFRAKVMSDGANWRLHY